MTKATATFEGDEVRIEFSGDLERHEEGDIVQNITVESVSILGVECDWPAMQEHEKLAAAVLEKADELEFTPIDSSDFDDIGD